MWHIEFMLRILRRGMELETSVAEIYCDIQIVTGSFQKLSLPTGIIVKDLFGCYRAITMISCIIVDNRIIGQNEMRAICRNQKKSILQCNAPRIPISDPTPQQWLVLVFKIRS